MHVYMCVGVCWFVYMHHVCACMYECKVHSYCMSECMHECTCKGLKYAQYAATCVWKGLKKHIYAVMYALLCMVLYIRTCLHLLSSALPTMRLRFCRVKSLLYVCVAVTGAWLSYMHSTLRANAECFVALIQACSVGWDGKAVLRASYMVLVPGNQSHTSLKA